MRFFLCGILLLLGACESLPSVKLALEKEEQKELANKKIYLVKEDVVEAHYFVSGKDMLNTLVDIGNTEEESSKTEKLRPPSEIIERALVGDLKKKYAVTTKPETISFEGEEKPTDMVAWAKANGYENGIVLDVETMDWGITPHPKSRTRYIVKVRALMNLYDLEAGTVLARHVCMGNTSSLPLAEAPTKYKLLKDDSRLMKRYIYRQSKRCAELISEKVF
ncbi:MAG: hypothetical protein DHS20C02_06550 [Micavibrio sp.]|nr:MAG: hypothetical protein DHS20C02_06550 [Micavibrio sp.]